MTAEDKQLKTYIERIERLAEERKTYTDDIKEVYAEAASTGYEAAIIRKIVALRAKDRIKRKQQEEMQQIYMAAIGEE